MGTTYQDGTLSFGTQLLTMGPLTGLIADKISLDDPTTTLTRKDNLGVPVAEVMIDGVMTGTAQIQVPSTLTALPPKGTHFTLTDVDGTTHNFKVEGWGRDWSEGETKLPLKFRQRFATGA